MYAADIVLGDPNNLDVVGERNDGGVDLVIACGGPLDDSDEICALLEKKINNYLQTATNPNFSNIYPAAKDGPIRIFVSDEYPVSARAQKVIAKIIPEALARGIDLSFGLPA